MRHGLTAILGAAIAAGFVFGTAVRRSHETQEPPQRDAPEHLRDTGLYADWERKIVAPSNLPFAPQYPLWTDGARKQRWIYLPPGTAIDASDPDAWEFPKGTRLWKEFSFGRRVETRYMQHQGDGRWLFATYVWNAGETDAVRATHTGSGALVVPVSPRQKHAIPTTADCATCHENGGSSVLGFSALQLSADRDPGALHVEPPPPGAVDVPSLRASGRLVGMNGAPARIPARTAIERSALGYLHANCGHCHDARGSLAGLGLDLRVDLADTAAAGVATTVDRASRAELPGSPVTQARRIAPGDPARSVLLSRIRSRDPVHQMPPLGTRLVDPDAVALIEQWIRSLD